VDIPALFAAAWNEGDADGIAALFEADAEFVNVTGLWWHDREAIRKAHAYGLTRIFAGSTLEVLQTRVKELSADVAVVHARVRLEGQTPVAGIARPGPRTTLFSFVVRRGPAGWLCAAAHNTDVVPGMETHIRAEDGRLHPVDYREHQRAAPTLARGDIFWIAPPAPGPAHPHVVVQDDVLNRSRIPTVVVVALTSNLHRANEPGNVLLAPGEGSLPRQSVAVVSQIDSIEKSRLGERIGSLSPARVDEIIAGLRFQQRSYFDRDES
jgi:uncharacterized protein (TIGR02246 family)